MTARLTMHPSMHTRSGEHTPAFSGPVMMYEVEGLPNNELVRILNTRPDGREPSWQIHRVGIDEGTGDYKTAEEALSALATMFQPKDLDGIKKEALDLGYTKIQREMEAAPVVALSTWPGFSSHVKGGAYAHVEYCLEGNKLDGHKVRVHKTLDGDHWYTLS